MAGISIDATLSPEEYVVAVARGKYPNTSLVTAFGYAAAVGGAVTNANLWELATTWTLLASAQSLELLSSSASDAVAGTGARSILVQGLDANFNQISETVVPNGTTIVALVNTYRVINNLTVLTAGSTNSNVGNITVRVASAGAIQAYIVAAAGASRLGRFTVPAGYVWVVRNFFFLSNGIAGTQASSKILATFILSNGVTIQGLPLTLGNTMSTTITVPDGVAVSATTTLAFSIPSVGIAGLDISGGCSGVLAKL